MIEEDCDAQAEELGRLELKVDTEKKAPVSWTWKRIPVDSGKTEPDAAMARQVKLWEDKVTAQPHDQRGN